VTPDSILLPEDLRLISQGHPGSGTHLMLTAIAESIAEAGLASAPPIDVGFDLDGGEAMRMVAAGRSGALGSCSPAYLTTPIVHGLEVTWRDLTPVAQLVTDSYLLVAPVGSVATAAELFAGPTTVAVPKLGGNTDIQGMLLGEATGTEVTVALEHDPAELRALLADGRAHWTTGVYSDFADDLAAGRLRVVATFDAEPAPSADAQTLRESGIDVVFPLWRGVIGPGDLPEAVVRAWGEALPLIVEQGAWQRYIAEQRQRDAYLPPAEFAELLADEDDRYRGWVRALERRDS